MSIFKHILNSEANRVSIKAKEFATKALAGQRRTGLKEKFAIDHACDVATLVIDHGGSGDEIAAAWLHDVVEDTKITLATLQQTFDLHIANIVDGLTDPPEFSKLPLLERKTLQAARLRAKSKGIKRVKLCDQIANLRDVHDDPPTYWDKQKCRDYTEGARRIAYECRGINLELDDEFEEIFRHVYHKYRDI